MRLYLGCNGDCPSGESSVQLRFLKDGQEQAVYSRQLPADALQRANINGFEVSQWVRGESEKRIPVVFVTAKDDAQSMKEGFRAGGTVYLTKPFTTTQLVKAVTSLIGK